MEICHNVLFVDQEEQRLHERRLGHWERLYSHVMQRKSHGRRWKFRIEPLRRKIASGWNPFQEPDSGSSDSEDTESRVILYMHCLFI